MTITHARTMAIEHACTRAIVPPPIFDEPEGVGPGLGDAPGKA